MHGSWVIVRTKRDSRGKASWLLIKHRDEGAVEGNTTGPTDDDKSVASGRTMVEITNGKGRAATPFMTGKGAAAGSVWQSNRDDSAPAGLIAPTKAKASSAKGKTVPNLPDFIEPQLTKLLDKPPIGPGWTHEIKFDGYRMQLRTEDGHAALRTRKGLDWTAKFRAIADAAGDLPSGIQRPRSQIITVPPPYWPLGMIPSNIA